MLFEKSFNETHSEGRWSNARQYVQKMAQHRFVRHASLLQIGSFFSTAVGVATSIVLARILEPVRYGEYTLVFALAGTLLLFTDVGEGLTVTTYLPKIHEEKNADAAKKLLGYNAKATLLFTVGVSMLGALVSPWLGHRFYGSARIGWYAAFVILSASFTILSDPALLVLQSVRRIRTLVFYEASDAVMRNSLKVLLLFSGFGILGVVVGHVAGALFFGFIGLLLFRHIRSAYAYLPSLGEIYGHIWRWPLRPYFSFGFLNSLSRTVFNLYTTVPLLLLGIYAPPATAGFYKIAFSYIMLPLVLLGGVSRLLDVQLPQSFLGGGTRLQRHFWRVSLWSGLIGSMLTICALLIAPWIIPFVYGEQYQITLPVIFALAPYPIISAFAVGVGAVYRTTDRMRVALGISAGSLGVVLAVGVPLFRFFGPLEVVTGMAVGLALISGSAHVIMIRRIFTQLRSGTAV